MLTDEKERSARTLTTILYALYASSIVLGFTSIVAVTYEGMPVLSLAGYLVLVASAVWFVHRIVKGFLYLNDGKPMYG